LQEDDALLPGPAIPGFAGYVRQITLSAITVRRRSSSSSSSSYNMESSSGSSS
jgi:hypothetical protein